MNLTETRILTVQEVAGELKLSVRLVRDMLRRRELHGAKVGRQYLIQAADLIEWLNRKKNEPIPPRAAAGK